jgi:hypothetical protein
MGGHGHGHDELDESELTPDEIHDDAGTVNALTEMQLDELETIAAEEDADEQITRNSADG